MYFEDILKQLINNKEPQKNNDSWDVATQTTAAIIEAYILDKKLITETNSLQTEVEQIEKDINSNSEFGKLSREISNLNSYLESAQDDYNRQIELKIELLNAISEIDSKRLPLENENNIVRKREKEYEEENIIFEQQADRDLATASSSQEALDDLNGQYARLLREQDRSINHLIKLKEHEAEIRNDFLESRTAPPINVADYQALIPTARGQKEKIDNDEEDFFPVEVNFFDKLQPGSKGQYHNSPVSCLSFANTNPFVASGGEDSVVVILRTDNYRRVARLCDAQRSIMAMAFSPSDTLFLTASYDSTIRFYKLPNFNLESNISDNRDCINDAQFMADDRVVSCCRDQTVKLYDVTKSMPISSFTSSSIPYSLTVLQSQVVTAHHDGKLRCWDFRSHGPPIEIKVHKSSVIQVIGSRSSSSLVSLGTDKAICVSDIRSKGVAGKVSILKSGLPSEHMQMAVSDESAIIGSTDGQIYNYNLETFKFEKCSKGHTVPVFCVAVKPILGIMATGDKSGNVMFWNK